MPALLKRSIYSRIISKIGKKGWLTHDFPLSEGLGAPGEKDAGFLYGSDIGEAGNEAFEQFMALLKAKCENPKKKSDKEFIEYLEKNHILKLLDRLCWEIYNERRGIDLIALLDASYSWAIDSGNINLVKLGISLMGMLNLDEREDCRDVIITLGKCEEFTLYSLYAISGWNDADKIAGDYAKNLKGWGKTHAQVWGP